jgi:hypothetical protein
LDGGMNSSVWSVDAEDRRYALKVRDRSLLP